MTVIFWAVATVAFIILELATVGLASIWFALGALCALIATLLGAPLWLQIVLFAVVSVATLLLTRPLAKKYINSRATATNADRVIGRKAVVKERIDELEGTGAVLADGKMWSARTTDGSSAEVDDIVIVREIRGVKLIVEPQAADKSEA
jgi:membrane protein implicated in regulation of membrane protease activity